MKKNKYSALPLWEKLTNKLFIYYKTVWSEKRFNASSHTNWLNNFSDTTSGDREKLNALYLLSKCMFFGQDEIRELLLSIYRDKFKYKIVEGIRKSNNNTTDLHFIENEFLTKLNTTRFVGLGDYSESGSYLSYPFRQVNNLPTRLLKHHSELLENGLLKETDVETYIILDDFCGSGETARSCNTLIQKIKKQKSTCKIFYYALFATESGIENISKYALFDAVEVVFKLDDSYKCFNSSSRYFNENYPEIEKKFAEDFSTKYGIPLTDGTPIQGHPLGFDNNQLLLAFSHNTPDNSLPIIWGENDWIHFFRRYTKIK